MLTISKTNVCGWEAAVRGMRNPLNSWDKSDSAFMGEPGYQSFIGENDLDLMKRLVHAGSDHGKFMRYIIVTCDVYAPLYWWKETDTYKVGTVANSCSTMHKIQAKRFTEGDFSTEHLTRDNLISFNYLVNALNNARDKYLKTKDKEDWWQMIQMLPSSYNQKRTLLLNYQVLRNMYKSRKNHKLDEWHMFCDWICTLPYSELITEADE